MRGGIAYSGNFVIRALPLPVVSSGAARRAAQSRDLLSTISSLVWREGLSTRPFGLGRDDGKACLSPCASVGRHTPRRGGGGGPQSKCLQISDRLVQRSSVWLSPSLPSPYGAGLSGESLSIVEGELVGGVSRGGPGRFGSVGFVDVGDGSAGEQASADEFGEADGDAQQEVGDHGGQQLQADGVGVAAEEGRDLEMLLEPAEQQLDLPACLVEAADLDGRALEVVGEEGDLGSVVAPQANAAHRD